ncbi:hypothetical protein HYU08_01780 [Candidatus Woesearchaeota archaeon]|nr:hypothetical protein [Candidatus Woesearchaeota archaeon]
MGYLALLIALDLAVISCAPEELEPAPTQAQESPDLEHRVKGALAGRAVEQSQESNRAWIELGTGPEPCGSDQECPMNYSCLEYKCVAPEDMPGLEWCDGIDNDGDSYIDEDQLGDKTFCDRNSLQSLAGYAFKHDQSYYIQEFETRWDEVKDNWKAQAETSLYCKIVNGVSVHASQPYNLQRPMKALLTMYRATQDEKWLNEATEIADSMIDAAVPFCCVPHKKKWQTMSSDGKTAEKVWDEWLDSLPTLRVVDKSWLDSYSEQIGVGNWEEWDKSVAEDMEGVTAYDAWLAASARATDNEDKVDIKLLYWDTSQCNTNPKNHKSGYYRLMEEELQGLRGISELARVLSSVDPEKAQKYYNYAEQVVAFYPMSGFLGDPRPALDRAADKRSLYIMNAYDLYQVKKDQRFLDWASVVSETLLNQETGTLTDLDDFVGIYWTVKSSPGEVDPFGIMDTSHANRLAEMARYWHEEDSSVMAKSMLPKMVNTFLFKTWQSDPQTKIGNNYPYPNLFKNYPTGSNPCSDPDFPSYSPYALGNVLFGWNELSRYDRRVLFTMESITDSLIEGTYVNDFSDVEGCNEQYSVKGNANPGMTINAIAEMAFATRPQP